ncbi:MAG: LCP family protein [Pseudonocardia sp.]
MNWIAPLSVPPPEADTPVERAAPPARRRRGRVVALAALAAVVMLAGAGFIVTNRLGDNVDRVPGVFAALDPAARPADEPGLTFLLMGTDSRAAAPTTGSAAGTDEGSARSDVVMVVRLAPDASSATVVSIPRDSWVDIPGRGPGKINAAYAYGGPSLLVRTVEGLTGVRVDHFAVVDFAGFQAMVDAVGGIDVQVAAPTSNYGVDFHAGRNHLDGAAALGYVRQRYDLPEGDLDRARRQQNALRALLEKVASAGTLADPVALYGFLDAATRSVGVDDSLTNGRLRELALEVRGLRPARVTFLSAPVRATGYEGDQSVVYLDAAGGTQLWAAVRSGAVREYVAANPAAELGEEPS